MKFTVTTGDLTKLREMQRTAPNRNLYIRATVILLLERGRSAAEIAEDLGIDDSTVHRYRNTYDYEGIEALLTTHYQAGKPRLDSDQQAKLVAEVEQTLYIEVRPIIEWVEQTYAQTFSLSGMSKLLNRLGFSYKQTKSIPCEANIEAQTAFLTTSLALLQEVETAPDQVAYFMDGVHPTHNTRSTHAWIRKGQERTQLTVSGRDRVNINGAINAHDVTDVLFDETNSVNAQSTQALFEQMILKNPTANTIFVFSDNARYYKNKDLQAWLVDKPIKQIFLPPYSPNLNLIERLWKFLRKKVINTQFYRTKQAFKAAILDFFNNINTYKEELVTLLTLNFHIFKPQTSFA
jgi:transposase